MVIFGRPISSYRRAALRVAQLGHQFISAYRVFREPWRCLAAYIFERPLLRNVVEFRDGLQIMLSSHPRDVATVFVVFIKRDYGRVPVGETVVDIGANIGCFSLYAARSGARRVFAFEPCKESFDCLCENVRRNGLDHIVVPFRVAVTDGDTPQVRFPIRSNPSNRIAAADVPETDTVPTTTIDEIVTQRARDVALMKIDCEGAEYDILAAASPSSWEHVAQLRIEYHDDRADELIDALEKRGFALTYHTKRRVGDEVQGDLWFER